MSALVGSAGHGEYAGEDAADVDGIDVAAQFSRFGSGCEHHGENLLDLVADRYFTLQKALPFMNDGGSIVLTVGIGVHRGSQGATVGAATRGALLAMLPSLALELAPRRIRVNAVSPGATDTPLLDKLGVPRSGRDAMRANIPFERFGSSEEVAQVVAFLASAAAGYVTGQEVVVAGGYGLGA